MTSHCGACGRPVLRHRKEGDQVIICDVRSDEVESRLKGIAELWGDPPEAPHPLCLYCFVGWIHSWLEIDP